MEYKGVESVHGEWEMEGQVVGEDVVGVLALDSQLSSHPILQTVANPDQISQLFDKISYSKGAAVIRMLEHFMGKALFRQGISAFLRKYSFRNAATADLWAELQTVSSPSSTLNISLVMDTWTRQAGYPLLTLDKEGEGVWSVSQDRFYIDGNSTTTAGGGEASPFNYTWEIPLSLQWEDEGGVKRESLLWMNHTTQKMRLGYLGMGSKEVKVNGGQFGYYRVKYNKPEMYAELEVRYGQTLSPEERCGVLDDLFSLAYANYVPYSLTLQFSKVLGSERHYLPWNCVVGHLGKLGRLVGEVHPSASPSYQRYVQSLVVELYEGYSWTDHEDDPHLSRLLKPLILGLACEHGHTPCLAKSKELFEKWMEKPDLYPVPAGLRPVVYKYGLGEGEVWETLWDRYLEEGDSGERVRLLDALAFSNNPPTLSKLLVLGKNEAVVRRQDYFTLLRGLAKNPVGNEMVWDYYRGNQSELVDRFSLNDKRFGRVILDITDDYTSSVQLQQLESFLAEHPEGGAGQRARLNALENVQSNVRWRRESGAAILSWLTNHTP